MLKHFCRIKKTSEAPMPNIDFNGIWCNELGSEMDLTVNSQGAVTGTYSTEVGAPGAEEKFDLVGFTTGDLLSFTVNFGAYGSLTSWVGQHTIENSIETIKTLWLLTKNVKDPDEPADLWGSVLTGYNNFFRKKKK